jgi:ABC-type polysaccharide/polyol phosphate transport system ATPase subunit
MPKRKKKAVTLKSVNKKYVVHHDKPTFVERLLSKNKNVLFHALKNINLDIYKGQKVGIIGLNGSGKTTLLKLICGITTPNKGSVKIKGKIISLIELTAGFHPDLTGAENIFLNGLLIGMDKKEIKRKFDSIIKFADIGDFIYAPFYTYSEGMKLRLGFSVAIHADPDILVLDEGIVTGDKDFQNKSSQKIKEFFEAGKTIIIVTHLTEYLEINCNRIIWLEEGKIKSDGGTEVLSDYLSSFNKFI